MHAKGKHPRLRRTMSAMDRAGLWIVGVGAALVAALLTAGLIANGSDMLGDGPLEVSGLPVSDTSTPPFLADLPDVTEARYGAADVVVEGVPGSARALLWSAEAVQALAAVGICLALVWLCVRVGRQRPFGRSLTVALLATASLVMIGGSVPQLLGHLGRMEVVDHLGLGVTPGQGAVIFSFELSLAPIGIGLALGVVAAAFEIGERLQRDTEGLV